MKIKVQVVIESDGGDTKAVENIACLDRGTLSPKDLGLTLDEAKALLESVQRTLCMLWGSELIKISVKNEWVLSMAVSTIGSSCRGRICL